MELAPMNIGCINSKDYKFPGLFLAMSHFEISKKVTRNSIVISSKIKVMKKFLFRNVKVRHPSSVLVGTVSPLVSAALSDWACTEYETSHHRARGDHPVDQCRVQQAKLF